MRPLLALETSGGSLGVALRSDSGLVFEENVTAGALHGKALAPLMQKALRAAGLQASELEAVAVSLGPGSWTGLRIGLSATKALAWGAGIGVVGVPSFEALAFDAARHVPGAARLAVRDARSEGWFFALFSETPGRPQRWIPESVLKPADLVTALDECLRGRSAQVVVCGDRVCQEGLRDAARSRRWTLRPQCEHISGAAVAECGWQRLLNGEKLASAAEIHRLAPLYLRASDPELKLARKLFSPPC